MSKFDFIIDGNKLQVLHHFNGKIDLFQDKLRCIYMLLFDEDYNGGKHPIFNQPIVLTPNIKVLRFEGTFFNHPIILTPNIEVLTF